jgi:DNA-binding GntR family transcriptional regulator
VTAARRASPAAALVEPPSSDQSPGLPLPAGKPARGNSVADEPAQNHSGAGRRARGRLAASKPARGDLVAGKPAPVSIAREPIFEAIVKQLREDVLKGVYPPRTPLRLQELADRFGTSLMPVREALHRLAAEGLIVSHARRGATVADFDAAEALEICELRALLMSHAVRLAATRLTEEDLLELEAVTATIDGLLAARPLDFERYLELNERFHTLICERSGNRHLVRILCSFDILGNVAMYRFFQNPDDLGRFNQEHRAILDALRARDADRVRDLVAGHFGRSVERMRELAGKK